VRTSIAGKVENTALPVSRPLAPLYEAIHNAFQAIEDGGGDGNLIMIEIERLPDMLHKGVARPISFTVTDTGIGFNEENAKSFSQPRVDTRRTVEGKGTAASFG
jgi:hypothetical protein